MSIRDYRDLIVWQKAVDLATVVFRLTNELPSSERFGLVVQMRRAAVSIPSNIAEGHERHSRGDFRRHVSMASGSLAELETQLEVSRRIGYTSDRPLEAVRLLTMEVGRMLSALLRRLRS
jgi:four helix bundle protein